MRVVLVGEVHESVRGAQTQLAAPVDSAFARPAVPLVVPIVEIEAYYDIAHDRTSDSHAGRARRVHVTGLPRRIIFSAA